MEKITLDSNSMYSVDCIIRESDKYSELAYLKLIKRTGNDDESLVTTELFLTTEQLKSLGLFLTNRATQIKSNQKSR